ncbi:type III-B CRISPR module RAMP protein Cmr1 [Rubrobacter calidifluminis]|uniref:type III-B CRISPR module RAMP protein Cmr1 n=1 Tax=Rubrobacter calidifluminis TaxID=1392640 RepID=UPI00235E934A|nr:type III-B CRISPR module RAMP protein Cmr1 [Rubrobacter calidifluminis]
MEKIEATFRVVTPMFMSGADQSKAELRLPSIKGALRFWWRALAWSRYGDLQKIREEETRLFGSTDEGQAAVLLKLFSQTMPKVLEKGQILKDGENVVGEGTRYLGYGVMEAFASKNRSTQAGQLIRPCLLSPFEFTLELRFGRLATEQQISSSIETLKLMGLVGSLGSKSRKGYGSLTLTKLSYSNEPWSPPSDVHKMVESLTRFSKDSPHPLFTAISRDSRFIVVEGREGESTLSLLDRVGREMMFYRSWGRNGTVLGSPSEKNFKDDHDLMSGLKTNIKYPRRVVFGLPHNYGKQRHLQVTPAYHDRRASPLFIHIHQTKNADAPLAVLSFLPSAFLPQNEPLKLLNTTALPRYDKSFWKPIDDFLERMKGTHQRPPRKRRQQFANVVEV